MSTNQGNCNDQAGVSLDVLSSIAEKEDNSFEMCTYLRTLYQSNNAQRRLILVKKLTAVKLSCSFHNPCLSLNHLDAQNAARPRHRIFDRDFIHYTFNVLLLSWIRLEF